MFPEKMVNVRWSYESIREVLHDENKEQFSQLNKSLSKMNRKFYHALAICYDGRVIVHNDNDRVLENAATYLPIIKKFQRTKELVWCFTNYSDNPRLLEVLRTKIGAMTFKESLNELADKYKIKSVEIDYAVLLALLSVDEDILYLKYYINLKGIRDDMENILQYTDTHSDYDITFICPAYGFNKYVEKKTSHGIYKTLQCHPECSFDDWFNLYLPLIHDQKVIMEIDTCAVEYTYDKKDKSQATYVRLVNREYLLRQLKLKIPHTEETDHMGCSMLWFPETAVSYDNDLNIRNKRDWAAKRGVEILLGELHNDIYHKSEQSLFHILTQPRQKQKETELCGTRPELCGCS